MATSSHPECEGPSEQSGGRAFFEIPLPPGATEGAPGTVRWDGLPFFLVPHLDLKPAEFGEFIFRTFEIAGSPGRAIEFFRENRGGWEERFSAVEEGGGILLWTSAGGRAAAWIAASEQDAGTALAIATAERAHPRS